MIDKAYRRRDLELPPANSLFATVDPPRSTAKQSTRWDTQDAAFTRSDNSQHIRILESIRSLPATCDEIEQRLELTHQSASACLNKLMKAKLIRATGKRLTRSGRQARVWESTTRDEETK